MLKHEQLTKDLIWCMRPALDLSHLRGPLPDKIRTIPPAQRPFRPATHGSFEGFFVATETVNQARALERLIVNQVTEVPVEVATETEREALFASSAFQEARQQIMDTLGERVSEAVRASFENQLYKVAIALNLYRNVDLSRFAGVLVATQHSPIMRALFVAAEEQRVPVVYVPHAPVAANGAYLDLPVSYAGLRGTGEQDFYVQQLGVAADRLDVVGNLASDLLKAPMPELRPSSPGVLALSPHQPEILKQIIDIVSAGDCGDMIIAPHPRSDLDVIHSLMPQSWSVYEGERTTDLLMAGPPFLFQFSSGVAWESAALGIPTATIRLDESPVNYPFLDEEMMYPSIRSAEDAQQFATSSRAAGFERAHLRNHAERWCALDGDEAAEQLRSLLAEVPNRGYRTRLHDGWTPGGIALSQSWLSNTLS